MQDVCTSAFFREEAKSRKIKNWANFDLFRCIPGRNFRSPEIPLCRTKLGMYSYFCTILFFKNTSQGRRVSFHDKIKIEVGPVKQGGHAQILQQYKAGDPKQLLLLPHIGLNPIVRELVIP